jgi:hypothetical protein
MKASADFPLVIEPMRIGCRWSVFASQGQLCHFRHGYSLSFSRGVAKSLKVYCEAREMLASLCS